MTKTIFLEIIGMHCISCVNNIEKELKKEKGIISVNINFASEKAKIEFDPEQISINKIQNIIQALGI